VRRFSSTGQDEGARYRSLAAEDDLVAIGVSGVGDHGFERLLLARLTSSGMAEALSAIETYALGAYPGYLAMAGGRLLRCARYSRDGRPSFYQLFDLEDPRAPALLDERRIEGPTGGFALDERRLVTTFWNGRDQRDLNLFLADVGPPGFGSVFSRTLASALPASMGVWSLLVADVGLGYPSGARALDVDLAREHLFIACDGALFRGVRVIDLTDPATPRAVHELPMAPLPRDVVVHDALMFVAVDESGVLLLQRAKEGWGAEPLVPAEPPRPTPWPTQPATATAPAPSTATAGPLPGCRGCSARGRWVRAAGYATRAAA
jgi:hypothetical protein